jgi:hypothetical protein
MSQQPKRGAGLADILAADLPRAVPTVAPGPAVSAPTAAAPKPEREETALINVHAPRTLVRRVKAAAVEHDTTLRAIVIEAVEAWLNQKKHK